MADNDLPSYRKAVYLVFDVIALGFVLEGVPRLIRQEWAGGSLLLAIAIVLIFVGIAIAKRVSEIQDAVKILWDRLPSQKKLAASLAENESLKKQLAAASTPQASMLKIHSAIYGIGNANDADLTEILQNAQREGLWLVVNNNLLPPGSKDPAPGSLKLLTVIYSFGNDPKKYTTVREEYQELVLPEDAGLIERTAKEYDDKGLADRAAQASTHDSERQRLEAEKTDLRRDLAMRPTQQDLVKLQNENADLRALLPPPLPPAPISVLDNQIASNARAAFTALSWAQRLALSRIYQSPGRLIPELVDSLAKLGFKDAEHEIVKQVLATNLVERNFTGNASPSPSPVIVRAVVAAFRESPLWMTP